MRGDLAGGAVLTFAWLHSQAPEDKPATQQLLAMHVTFLNRLIGGQICLKNKVLYGNHSKCDKT